MFRISLFSIFIFTTASIIFAQPAMQKLSDDCEKFSFDEPAKGIQVCTQLIQAQPNNSDAYHNRGLAYERISGNLAELKTQLEINAYWENNRKALADFTKAVEFDPKSSFKLGSLMRVQKEILKEDEQDQLLETIKKIKELTKDDETTWLYEQAAAYLKFRKKGDSDEVLRKRKMLAIDDYTALIKGYEETNSSGYRYRGIVYFQLEDLANAYKDLSKAALIDKEDNDELLQDEYNLGKVCTAKQDWACAADSLAKALDLLNQKDSSVCYEYAMRMEILDKLAEALKKQNKKEEAEKYKKIAKEKCQNKEQ